MLLQSAINTEQHRQLLASCVGLAISPIILLVPVRRGVAGAEEGVVTRAVMDVGNQDTSPLHARPPAPATSPDYQ